MAIRSMLSALLLLSIAAAAATPDPSQCPYELGYNPSFNANGTILSCSKGQETFQVDPDGILPASLRGIGQAVRVALAGLIAGDIQPFADTLEPGATFQLPDGIHTFDAVVQAALTTVFHFAPGSDANAVFQVSDYHFLSNGPPRVVSAHLTIYSEDFISNFDAVYRQNLVNGSLVWQVHSNTGFVAVPI